MSGLSKLYFGWSAYFKTPWANASLPESIKSFYQVDGITLFSGCVKQEKAMLILEAQATHAPSWITGRLKGRLNHHFKRVYPEFPGFDRSFLLQSLGQNDRGIVSAYVQNQVDSSDLVDPLYRKRMNELRFHEEGAGKRSTSHRGRYDLVVHVVLVIANRHRIFSQEAKKVFEALVEGCGALGAKPYDISMMPDHAHLMVGWPATLSAEELLEGIKREAGEVMRRSAYWQDGGYVGTVGPYKMSVALERNRRFGGW
ncbi:transposase [Kiritimatiellaeota bacterium B1221]|nr:transposase [Kiritimatiellaeota bacterium B1221]